MVLGYKKEMDPEGENLLSPGEVDGFGNNQLEQGGPSSPVPRRRGRPPGRTVGVSPMRPLNPRRRTRVEQVAVEEPIIMTRSSFDAVVEVAVQRAIGKRHVAKRSHADPQEEIRDNLVGDQDDQLGVHKGLHEGYSEGSQMRRRKVYPAMRREKRGNLEMNERMELLQRELREARKHENTQVLEFQCFRNV